MDSNAEIRELIRSVMRISFREMRAKLVDDGADEAVTALRTVWAMWREPDLYSHPLWGHARSTAERCAAHVLDRTFSEVRYWARDPDRGVRVVLEHARAQFGRGMARHNLLGVPHPHPCRLCLGPAISRVEPANDWEKSVDPEYLAAGKERRLPPGQQSHFDWKQKMEAEQAEYERQLSIDRANGYMTVDDMVEAFDKDQCCHCKERQFLEDLALCSRCGRHSCRRTCGEWTTEISGRWLCHACIPAAIIESAHRFS